MLLEETSINICFYLLPRSGQLQQPSSVQPTLCSVETALGLLTQTPKSAPGVKEADTYTHARAGAPLECFTRCSLISELAEPDGAGVR